MLWAYPKLYPWYRVVETLSDVWEYRSMEGGLLLCDVVGFSDFLPLLLSPRISSQNSRRCENCCFMLNSIYLPWIS